MLEKKLTFGCSWLFHFFFIFFYFWLIILRFVLQLGVGGGWNTLCHFTHNFTKSNVTLLPQLYEIQSGTFHAIGGGLDFIELHVRFSRICFFLIFVLSDFKNHFTFEMSEISLTSFFHHFDFSDTSITIVSPIIDLT